MYVKTGQQLFTAASIHLQKKKRNLQDYVVSVCVREREREKRNNAERERKTHVHFIAADDANPAEQGHEDVGCYNPAWNPRDPD